MGGADPRLGGNESDALMQRGSEEVQKHGRPEAGGEARVVLLGGKY